MSNPVPNLPPTSGVQDLAVRSFLDALAQAWTVRNGQTRVTDERFLTVKDLTDGINLFKNGGGGGTLSGDAAPSPSANAIAVTLADLSAEIMQSRLYRWLGERIDRIKYMNRPDWLPPGNSAMVKEEITELVDDYHALAKKVTTAAAEFSGNLSVARQELSALSTAQEATAKQVTTLQTDVNNNFALVNSTLESHTTSISSQASAITTLQTDVGASQSTAQQAFNLAQDIDGNLQGTWGVKFDANGYVAGFGMALDGTTTAPTSSFGVRSDKFFIGPPANSGASSVPSVLPFIVRTSPTMLPNGTVVPAGVYMNNAMVDRLSGTYINGAYINGSSIYAGEFRAGKIFTGSSFYDSTSGYEIPSVASGSWQPGVDIDGINPVTSANLRFYGNGLHSTAPRAQRVKDSSLVRAYLLINACATADHYVSVWYRINDGIYDGPWMWLATVVEPQADYGATSIHYGAPINFSGDHYFDIGVSATDSNNVCLNTGKSLLKYMTVTVSVINV